MSTAQAQVRRIHDGSAEKLRFNELDNIVLGQRAYVTHRTPTDSRNEATLVDNRTLSRPAAEFPMAERLDRHGRPYPCRSGLGPGGWADRLNEIRRGVGHRVGHLGSKDVVNKVEATGELGLGGLVVLEGSKADSALPKATSAAARRRSAWTRSIHASKE